MAEVLKVLRPKEFHSQFIIKGQRADGRGMTERRNIKIETDAIKTADSSSLVKWGNTNLVCGCTAKLIKESEIDENSEELQIRLELDPISSSHIQLPNHISQILTNKLRAIINDSCCIDKQSLHLPNSTEFWSIDVEIVCLHYDGAIVDAALVAFLTALDSLRLPSHPETGQGGGQVKINCFPLGITFAYIDDFLLTDPNYEEESISSTTIFVAMDSMSGEIFHIDKTGGKRLPDSQLMQCINQTEKIVETIRIKLDENREVKMD